MRENYNKIAQEFSQTRQFMWQDLKFLLKYSTKGDKVLDLGCGNGRLFEALKGRGVDYVGVDNAQELVKIAREKYPQARFETADGLSLPFRNNAFDKVYSIAVLHHIPSQELRQQFLKEAQRVLRPGGLLILTVWKLGQKQGLKLLFKFSFLKIIGKNKMDFGDVLIPWSNQCDRYKHNFSQRGLKRALQRAGFQVKEAGILWRPEKKNANIYAIAKKV